MPLFVIAAAWLLLTVAVGGLAWSLLLSKRKTDAMRAEHEARSSELAPVSGMAQAPAIVWHSEGDGLRQLFCRTDTVLLLLFMCTANLNQTFYIETFADQIRALGASAAMLPERAEEIVELFDVIFPLLSLGTTPLAIFLVNRCRLAAAPPHSIHPYIHPSTHTHTHLTEPVSTNAATTRASTSIWEWWSASLASLALRS